LAPDLSASTWTSKAAVALVEVDPLHRGIDTPGDPRLPLDRPLDL